MKLYRVNHEIWGNNIYLLPTVQIKYNCKEYMYKNLAIELHFLVFHVRFLFFDATHQK